MILASVAFLVLIGSWLVLPASTPTSEPTRVVVSRRSLVEA